MNTKKKRTQVIFWLIIIGLLVSMVIAFTPTLNGLFGGGNTQLQKGAPALVVNGETLYELDVARAQQNPPFNQGFQGEVGDDLNILLIDSLIQNTILNQAASKIKISDAEVRNRVNEFRSEQGLAGSRNDQAYLNLIGQYGFTDATFRDYWRSRLRSEKYQEELTRNVSVSEAEVAGFYELNKDNYQSEEKIKARVIVLDDAKKAEEILAQAKAGEDFAALAKEHSLERADRNGALGAAEGSTDPQPVGRAALPTAVASAAFGLQATGLTEVVSANEKFYIVSVEEFIAAAAEPLDAVKEKVQGEALEAKKAGILEQAYTDLRNKAQISIPSGSPLTFEDTVVAKVGDFEMKRSELAQAVYLSPQIQQALSPGMEQIITGIFKPSYLDQMINREVAYQGSKELAGANFFGTKGLVSQQALQYVSRDAAATPEEIQKYYEDNLSRYTDLARAVVHRVNFETQEAALAFREAMLAGAELQATAESNGGIVVDLGTVNPGSLSPEIDDALFKTNAFDKIIDSEEEVSDVLVIQEEVEASTQEAAEETATTEEASSSEEGAVTDASQEAEPQTRDIYVVLVGTRTPERVRPFEEVKAQVETTVLSDKRAELQKTWLEGLKEKIKVENLLSATSKVTPPETTFETTPLDAPVNQEQPSGDLQNALENAAETATEVVAETSANVTDTVEAVTEAVTETAQNATETVTEAAETAQDVAEAAGSVVEAATEAVENVGEAVTETAENAVEATTETVDNVTEAVTEATERAAEAVTEAVEEAANTTETATETTTAQSAPATGSISGGIGTSFNFSAMENQAKDLAVKIRALAGRSDLSGAEQDELKKLQTSLETAQRNIVRLRGAQAAYKAKEGDTLASIAKQYLGSEDQAAKILEANAYMLGTEGLFPGAVLVIPKQ